MNKYFVPKRENTTCFTCTKCVYRNVYIYATVKGWCIFYATMTAVGIEISISDAQFVGFLSLAPLFAQLDKVAHACLLQNIPLISS